jgi:hypothetical protein
MATRQVRMGAISAERWFFAGMAMAMVLTIVAGFMPSYYLRGIVDPGHPLAPMTPLVHLHGALFTGWMLLFLAQVLLVANGRTDIHRKLGIAAVLLLPAMIVVGTLSGLHQVARASGPPITSPLNWLSIPLLSVPLYTGLIGWALIRRRDSQAHKRLMLIAMIEMTSPGFGRLPWPAFVPGPVGLFGFSDMFLLALIAWDYRQFGHIHRATAVGGAALVGSQILRLAVWDTAPWLAFARWAVSLIS